jgi:hypothetical protein
MNGSRKSRLRTRRLPWIATLALCLPAGSSAAQIEIGGTLVDPAKQPLRGALVELHRSTGRHDVALAALEDRSLQPVASARSDERGGFRLAAPEPGMWRLVFRAPGRRTQELRLEPVFRSLELRPVTLPAAREVAVTARDAAGAPVAGALVLLIDEGAPLFRDLGSEPTLAARSFARTGPDGVARLEGPAEGEWSLDVAAPGHAPAAITGERGSAAAVTLRPGRDRPLVVRAPDGAAAAGALITVGGRRLPWGLADAEGRAVVTAPFDQSLSVQAAAGTPALGLATLEPVRGAAPGPPVEVRLESVALAGRVVRAKDGAPYPGAWVWDPESPAGLAVADAEGRYALAATPRPRGASTVLSAGAPDAFESVAEVDPARAVEGEGPTLALARGAVLAGVVVDGDGRAVAGAELRMRRPARSFSRGDGRPQRSGADGRFELAPVRADDPARLAVRAEGFAPATVEVAAIPPGGEREVRVALSAGRRALGTVVDLSDRPIAGAEVTLTESAGGQALEALIESRLAAERPAGATTDAEGRFAVADLAPGRYDLEARAPGFAPARVPAVEVPAEGVDAEIGTVALSPGVAVEGVVRDPRGVPLAGVQIRKQEGDGVIGVVRVVTSSREPPEATTDETGRFRLDDLAEGAAITVRAELEGYGPASVQGVRAPTVEPLELVLSPASTLRGSVVDALGEGIPRATVALTAEMGSVGADVTMVSSMVRRGRTDEEGRFELADVVPGRYELRASGGGFQEGQRGGIEVVAGRDPEEVRLVLEKGAVLRGMVLDDAGEPVAGAAVNRVVQRRSPFDFGSLERGARTDADGRYRLDGLPTGAASISVEHSRHPRQVRDFVIQPGDNLLDFRLESGHEIAGRVVDETGLPVGGATVSARAPSAGFAVTVGGRNDPVTDEGGEFTLEGLADGSYRVTARKEGYAEASTEELVRLEGRSVYGVELRLSVGAAITGQVLGLEFDELASVQVMAMQAGAAGVPSMGQVDYEGRYRLDHVAAGDWMVMANVGRGGKSVRENVTVEPGAAEVILDLDFGGGLAIRGQVTRSGEPVPGAMVFASGRSKTSSSQGITDQYGRFVLLNLESDTYRVVVASRGGGASHEQEVEVAGADAEVAIELRESVISGRVIDAADRTPVEGAAITVVAVDEDSLRSAFGGFGAPPRSGAGGGFRIGGISPGAWMVRAEKEGYAAGTAQVEVGDGLDVEGMEIELEPARGLTLVVLGPLGRPVDQATVVALDASERPVLQGSYSAGEGGAIRLAELPEGRWTILVATGESATASLEVDAPGDEVSVRLPEAGSLRVRVPELEGTGLQASARLLDAGGRPYRSASFFQATARWPVSDGVGLLSQVPVGTWTLEVSTPDETRNWSQVVRVVPGTTLEVPVQ